MAVNCSAIPETLLESELFGHEKGAFTGAMERRAGYFELADAGTIFLDEITEMSPSLQAKYLRALQDGAVRRLGGKTEVKVDVRIIAATNRDPLQAVKDGAFREDLYYRLNVLNIALPPLRQRREDLPLLVEAFVKEFNDKYDKSVTGLDDGAMRLITQHDWPGNVRELRNTMERAIVQSTGDRISAAQLPFGPPAPAPVRARRRGRPARRHQARAGRARAHPAHARGQPPQQDPRRRHPRRHPQDPPQQAPALRGRSGGHGAARADPYVAEGASDAEAPLSAASSGMWRSSARSRPAHR